MTDALRFSKALPSIARLSRRRELFCLAVPSATGAVVLCVVGSMAAMIMLCARVYYAMARDGVFLPAVSKLHPVFGTPMRAIGIQGIMTSLLIALGAFEQIIAYFLFVAVFFIGLTVCTLFVFRRRDGGKAAPVMTPGYPATPLVFLQQIVVLLALVLMNTPWQAPLGCAVVLLGIPVYALLQRGHMVPTDDAESIPVNAVDAR